MPDPLATIAAAVMTQRIKERDKRLALTAAAAFIDGPLALAPALLGLQNQDQARGGETGGSDLLKEEVEVPSVTGRTYDEAKGIVEKARLRPIPENHVGTDAKLFHQVYKQIPVAGTFLSPGSSVVLSVHRPPPRRKEDLYDVAVQVRDLMVEEAARRSAAGAVPYQGGVAPASGATPGAGAAPATGVTGGAADAAADAKADAVSTETAKGKKP